METIEEPGVGSSNRLSGQNGDTGTENTGLTLQGKWKICSVYGIVW